MDFPREKKKFRKRKYETAEGWKRRAIKYRDLYKMTFAHKKMWQKLYLTKYWPLRSEHRKLIYFLSNQYPEILEEYRDV